MVGGGYFFDEDMILIFLFFVIIPGLVEWIWKVSLSTIKKQGQENEIIGIRVNQEGLRTLLHPYSSDGQEAAR